MMSSQNVQPNKVISNRLELGELGKHLGEGPELLGRNVFVECCVKFGAKIGFDSMACRGKTFGNVDAFGTAVDGTVFAFDHALGLKQIDSVRDKGQSGLHFVGKLGELNTVGAAVVDGAEYEPLHTGQSMGFEQGRDEFVEVTISRG